MNTIETQTLLGGGVYKHFKGNLYQVENIATHTETGEDMVVYSSLEDGKRYVRPYNMFASKVDKDKYPDVAQVWRFELIENNQED